METDTGVVDRDVTHSSRWGIAPSLALGLGTDTPFTLSYIHQQTVAIPDYGLVVAQNPGGVIAEPVSEYGVPRSNFTGFATDRDRNSADIVTAKISHVATDWLTIENDARVAVYSRYFQYTTVDLRQHPGCDNQFLLQRDLQRQSGQRDGRHRRSGALSAE